MICQADQAFSDALRARVSSSERFSAFLEGIPFYINLDGPCPQCGGFRRRTRDRSCYQCHLRRGDENFERMRAGIAPIKRRSADGHRDMLERRKAEKRGEFLEREFDGLTARRWPLGRLEIIFPDGHVEVDFAKLRPDERSNAVDMFPALHDVLKWAGWY